MGSQTNLASGVLLAVLGVFIVLRSVVKNGEGKTLVDQIIELGSGGKSSKQAANPFAGPQPPARNLLDAGRSQPGQPVINRGLRTGAAGTDIAKKAPKAQTPSPITDPLSGLLGLIP